jgi:hypothetical protein
MAIAALVARAKVGAKLRSAVMSDAELRARIDGIPNEEVATVLNGSAAAIDLNAAVVDGLSPFRTWWESNRPGPANANVATGLFGCWIADTLTEPTDTLSIPEWLVDEVISGRPGRHNAA